MLYILEGSSDEKYISIVNSVHIDNGVIIKKRDDDIFFNLNGFYSALKISNTKEKYNVTRNSVQVNISKEFYSRL
jgi:hypothetical protein